MTGLPGYNLPAFAAAKEALDAAGYESVNPGERGVIEGYTHADYMRDAIRLLVECDAICLLPGWEDSRGANIEWIVGNACGMTACNVDDWLEAEV
jgi:hypothetical protein